MCQANGKEISHWFATEDFNRYADAISKKTGLARNSLVVKVSEGFPAKKSTWIHPDMAVKLGRWISVDFELWCDEYIKNYLEKPATQPQQLKDIVWQRRLVLFLEKTVIPYDYFCIFTEATCGLIAQFETIGYVLPESATIDISIGQHWVTYLKTQFKDIEIYRQKYPHYYPDSRGQIFANMYKLDLLPMFRRWMETDYKMWHLEDYLKKKDRQALYVLADLMGEPLLPGIVDDLTKKKLAG